MFEKVARIPRIEMPKVIKRYHAIAPTCAVCTRDESAKANAPRSIPVEWALIVRDANYYFAIAHCHGDTTIVNISHAHDGMPSDGKVRATFAFTEKRSGRTEKSTDRGASSEGIRGHATRESERDRKQGR